MSPQQTVVHYRITAKLVWNDAALRDWATPLAGLKARRPLVDPGGQQSACAYHICGRIQSRCHELICGGTLPSR